MRYVYNQGGELDKMNKSQQSLKSKKGLCVTSVLLLGICSCINPLIIIFVGLGMTEDANSWSYKYSDLVTAILYGVMNILATIGCTAPIWFIELENERYKLIRQVIVNVIYFMILSVFPIWLSLVNDF